MPSIKITFIDDTSEIFPETHYPGGSYNTSLSFDSGFAIIENANGKQIIFPESRIKRIEKESSRRSW